MRKLLATLTLILMAVTIIWANTHPVAAAERCFDHTDETTVHGQIIDGSVVLNPFDAAWFGDRWVSLTVDGLLVVDPVAGVPYGQEVQLWTVCKGETETTTTTTERETTTTTERETTTTTEATTTTPVPFDSVPTTTTVLPFSPPPTLPYGGINSGGLFGVGVAFLLLGGLVWAVADSREEET